MLLWGLLERVYIESGCTITAFSRRIILNSSPAASWAHVAVGGRRPARVGGQVDLVSALHALNAGGVGVQVARHLAEVENVAATTAEKVVEAAAVNVVRGTELRTQLAAADPRDHVQIRNKQQCATDAANDRARVVGFGCHLIGNIAWAQPAHTACGAHRHRHVLSSAQPHSARLRTLWQRTSSEVGTAFADAVAEFSFFGFLAHGAGFFLREEATGRVRQGESERARQRGAREMREFASVAIYVTRGIVSRACVRGLASQMPHLSVPRAPKAVGVGRLVWFCWSGSAPVFAACHISSLTRLGHPQLQRAAPRGESISNVRRRHLDIRRII